MRFLSFVLLCLGAGFVLTGHFSPGREFYTAFGIFAGVAGIGAGAVSRFA